MDDVVGWFDRLYAAAGRDPRAVPWAGLRPHPAVQWFLDHSRQQGGRAVVVGCGLGDDAEAVAAAGWETIAFDVSPAAVEWATERFPDSSVDYRVADLLSPDMDLNGDLVIEVRTIQSLPRLVRAEAVAAVARLVSPGGLLLVAALWRPHEVEPEGPPWAVSDVELAEFGEHGLVVSESRRQGGERWLLLRRPD